MAEKMVTVKLAEGYPHRVKSVVRKKGSDEIEKRYAEAGDTVEIPAQFYTKDMGKIVDGDEEAQEAARIAAKDKLQPGQSDPDVLAADLNKMTLGDLKALAAEKEVEVSGSSKADYVSALAAAGVKAPEK